MELNILNKVNSPSDVKKLNNEELNILAQEIRDAVINRVSKIGGHFGPNLGIVEATIAMHYVLIHLQIRLYMMFLINLILTKY